MHMIAHGLIQALIARSGGDLGKVSFFQGDRGLRRGLGAPVLGLRAVKRRPKTYRLLTKPLHEMVEEAHRGKRKNAA